MSQYVFLKQANGEFLKLLADDDGIIQYTTNGDAFDGIIAGSAAITTDATLSGDGSSGDPLTVLSAPMATTADGPVSATVFTAALNVSTTSLKGLQSATGRAEQFRFGANLVDGNQTLSPGSDKVSSYILPAATLTGGATITLAATGCSTGDYLYLYVQQVTGSFNNSIVNDIAGNLVTFNCATNAVPAVYIFYFTGGHWTFNARAWSA